MNNKLPHLKSLVTLLYICSASVYAKEITVLPKAPTLPKPLLAYEYSPEMITQWHDWYASEKYDGIRAIWTGSQLITRQGNILNPPLAFKRQLPDFPIEGELWIGRGQFNQVMRTVLDKKPDQAAWSKIQFMVFDLPQSAEPFLQRYEYLKNWIEGRKHPQIQLVKQIQISEQTQLQQMLEQYVNAGAEGLMLRHGHAVYVSGRDRSLLKLKMAQDAEAVVIGHQQGKGKYQDVLGSLLVVLPNGKQFKIGTGFSDEERKNPPQIGDKVTFEFNGLTVNGIPKFARFMRVDETKQ